MASEPVLSDQERDTPASDNRTRSSWRGLWQRIRSITPSELARLVLVLLALGALGWLIWFTWSTLLPFQVGAVLAYLLLPLVNRLEHHMPRGAAIGVVFLSGLIILVLLLGFVIPALVEQISQLIAALPRGEEIVDFVMTTVNDLQDYIGTLPPAVQTFINDGVAQAFVTIRDNITEYIQTVASFLVSTLLSIAGTFAFLFGFLVIPFWLFFVLQDQRKGLRAIDNLLPSWARADFWALFSIPDRVFMSYIRGQLFLGTLIAIASYLGLTALELFGVEGIEYKLLLAVFAGIMELVPYIGPIIGAVPAVAVGLMHSWETALAIALLYLVIQQLEGNLLIPKVLGESVNIHPAILTALLIALTQLGFIWFLLAAPLAATIRDIYRYIYGRVSDPPRPAGLLPDEALPEEPVQLSDSSSAEQMPEDEPVVDQEGRARHKTRATDQGET